MSTGLVEAVVPLLALGFAASALYRLARTRFPGRTIGLWALPKGPGYVLTILEILSALFLVIPMMIVWGLVLASMIAACHVIALWRPHPVRT
jgi:hypothetical protein